MSWYEVWADESHDRVPYLLMLRPSRDELGAHDGGYEILDPKEGDRRVFRANTYDEAQIWLDEDEFDFVGRREIEEP